MFLKPDYNLKCIYDIDLDELKKQGIKGILFDLDSTIMASKSACYNDKTTQWLQLVQESFFMAVVSNNQNPDYIEKVRAISDFPLLFGAAKPKTGPVREFMKQHNVKAEETVIVGDRPLTDILCGKLIGVKTILVDSITADSEPLLTRFVRRLERCCIKK